MNFVSSTGYYEDFKKFNKGSIKRANEHLLKKISPIVQKNLSEDSIENDVEFSKVFAEKFQNFTIPMPKDHVFADTDLVIFKDSYKGRLPLNGITYSDFLIFEQIYNEIITEKTILGFKNCDDQFKKEMFYDLRILMSREISRGFLYELLNENEKIYIEKQSPGESSSSRIYEIHGKEYGIVRMEPNPISSNLIQSNNHFLLGPSPRFIVLFHELTHQFYSLKNRDYNGMPIEGDYHNLEEKFNIRGFDSLFYQNSQQKIQYFHYYDYRLYNEWAVSTAFGILPRDNHLIGSSFHPDVHPNARDYEGNTPLHEIALSGADIDADLLIKKGANINAQNKEGQTPIWLSIYGLKFDIAKKLIDHGANLSLLDHKNRTIKQYVDHKMTKETNRNVKRKLSELQKHISQNEGPPKKRRRYVF